MTSNRTLARNTAYNLGGQIAPLAVAVIAIPRLIEGLGTSRFAILTLVWAAIGYFGLFDFGLGRALTHAIATRIGSGDTEDLGAVTWTGLAMMLAFGVTGAVLLAALTPLLIDRVLNVPTAIRAEARIAFYVMAAAVPATLLAAALRGVLEAHQDFPIASVLRVPLGMLNYLGPLAVLPFSHNLVPVVIALCCVRLLGALLHGVICVRRYAFLRQGARLRTELLSPLLRYGGWLTVTNVVSPLMANLDRFMIGAILPVAAVAYYVTPFELVSKLFIIPGAVLGVLFPAFAATFALDRERTAALIDRGMRVVLLAVFPVTLAVVCLAHEGLAIWINADFAQQSTRLMQWLAVGVLINCAGQVVFTALQGVGRPDLTAKVHLFELPFYLGAIWWFTHAYGLVGVAVAWTLRVTVDAAALALLTATAIPESRRAVALSGVTLGGLISALIGAATLPTLELRLAALVIGTGCFVVVAWTLLLHPAERAAAKGWLVFRSGAIRPS